jgi:hypothetical protein
MAIEMTPSETPGTKDLATMVKAHLGRTFSAQNQTFDFGDMQEKTNSFSDYLATRSGTLSPEILTSGIYIELLADEHHRRHFPAADWGGTKIRISAK